MPAYLAYNAFMKENAPPSQYTLRNVPAHIDRTLRRLAKQQDKSMNQLILDVLERVLGAAPGATPQTYHDLDTIIRSWVEDTEVDKALAMQAEVDKDLWK